jgi:acyl-CoA thioester hydrolase
MNREATSIVPQSGFPPDLEVPVRVQYYETDRMGVVHHANYLRYFESARMEQFRHWGRPYEQIEEAGCYLMITDMQCQCRAPARFGDLIKVRVRVTRMTRYRIFHEYTIEDEQGKLLARGRTALASVDDNGYPLSLRGYVLGASLEEPQSGN